MKTVYEFNTVRYDRIRDGYYINEYFCMSSSRVFSDIMSTYLRFISLVALHRMASSLVPVPYPYIVRKRNENKISFL